MRRLVLLAALAALGVSAPPAAAGIAPLSPKQGDSVPAGKGATFKLRVTGRHSGVFVHVCKRRRVDRDGMICRDELIGRAKRQAGSRYGLKARFFDLPDFWLNRPGTYYWQAYRAACDEKLDDCRAEGPVVRFKVA